MRRILIGQAAHAAKLNLTPGQFYSVANGKIDYLGSHFHATVLSSRETAIRVEEHCSPNEAVERYHYRKSRGFQRLLAAAQTGAQSLCYAGPELLLYIHETDQLATYLMTNKPAKSAWESARQSTVSVRRFQSRRHQGGYFSFFVPTINGCSFTVPGFYEPKFREDIQKFVSDVGTSELGHAVDAVRETIQKQLSRYPKLTRSQILDLIDEAAG